MHRYIYFAIAVSIILFTNNAVARPACKDGSFVTDDIVNCVLIDLDKSDTKLNKLYQKIIKQLSPIEQTELKQTEIKWIKSKNDCIEYTNLNKYGTSGRYEFVGCLVEKTDQRIEFLLQFEGCYTKNDPNKTRVCLQDYYNKLDKKLNFSYQDKIKILIKKNSNKQKKVLQKTEIQWIKQKEDTCSISKKPSDFFSDIDCKIRKTQEQISFLEYYEEYKIDTDNP